ncbi:MULTISPECIES: alpha/beta hydrolase [unclassified Clostridium]|uniref:alpha/beta hydrolase n=1 Tax=unclassified Clostridium TaxID=2614128 RepID=UPI001897397A|nr:MULTISPECIES: alpha/beta hydrolase [unclassified Clostridium]MCR1952325.1 alpha/beta hydrolase [Clostridium sp. DSM 100503]
MINNKIEEKIAMIPIIYKILHENIQSRKNDFENFKYGENIKQYYRTYKGDKNKPIIFFIHGGGWWHGSPKTSSCIGKFFNDLGYNVVLPAYRLVPLYKYPTQIDDVFMSLKDYLLKENDIENKKIIVIGFSAGGELAANIVFNVNKQKEFGINSDIFKGLITLAGVLDFEKCKSKHSITLIENYIGKDNSFKEMNPINLLKESNNIPTLCLHGNKDPLINLENSISFVDKVNSLNGNAKLKILDKKHHSDIISLVINKGEKESKIILDFIEDIWRS